MGEIRFWVDTWFGTPPVVQFLDSYVICNEQNNTIQHVGDGSTLMFTFRRNFYPSFMQKWYELKGVASSISFSDECDSLIWQYESVEELSTSSLYANINFGGVTPIFIPTV
jgi:hypothetical protein